jgi:hypothetical protein
MFHAQEKQPTTTTTLAFPDARFKVQEIANEPPKLVMVTPTLAGLLLQRNTRNRKVNKRHVEKLKRDMLEGRWEVNDQGISFCAQTGELLNGQHRLMAIVEAGIQMPVWVFFLADEARWVTDKGLKRNLGAELTMLGVGYGVRRAAILNMAVALLTANDGRSTVSCYLEYEEQLPKFEDGIDMVISKIPAEKYLSAAWVCGSIAFAYKRSPEQITTFADKFYTGEGLFKGDPIYEARKYVTGRAGRTGRADERMVNALVILNTMQAHIEGRTINHLKPSQTALDWFRAAYRTRMVQPELIA